MKTNIKSFLSFIFATVFFASLFSCNNRSEGTECPLLSESAQRQIVQEYVNALDSFAMAMPIVGSDTESYWAADTTHTMAQRVRGRKDAYLENMADIYLMHDYIAYGMSYFSAILGSCGASPELSAYTLRNMVSLSDSLHEAFIAGDCTDLKVLSDFAFLSIHNMRLFYTLNNQVQDEDFEDPDFFFGLNCMMMVDSLVETGMFSDREIYQAYCFLESSAFFKMIFPLMRMCDNPSGLATENQPLVLEAASFFDEKAVPVTNYFREGTKIHFLGNDDFEEYMLKATGYKAALLRIATREMLAMKDHDSSNSR